MSTNPAFYQRQSSKWADLLGQPGEVIAVTTLRVTIPSLSQVAPLDYALIELANGVRQEFQVAGAERVQPGDKVVCVWRKMSVPDESDVINYGIKVQKSGQNTV